MLTAIIISGIENFVLKKKIARIYQFLSEIWKTFLNAEFFVFFLPWYGTSSW